MNKALLEMIEHTADFETVMAARLSRIEEKLDRLTSMVTLLQENLSPSVYPPNRTQNPPLVSG